MRHILTIAFFVAAGLAAPPALGAGANSVAPGVTSGAVQQNTTKQTVPAGGVRNKAGAFNGVQALTEGECAVIGTVIADDWSARNCPVTGKGCKGSHGVTVCIDEKSQ